MLAARAARRAALKKPYRNFSHEPISWDQLDRSVGPNDLQLWKLLEGREVEPGLGEEALQEAGLVLHPPQPGLDQHGQLIDVLLDQVGQ